MLRRSLDCAREFCLRAQTPANGLNFDLRFSWLRQDALRFHFTNLPTRFFNYQLTNCSGCHA